MKAIGEVQSVGGAHFVERTSLLSFLDEMIAADSVAAALQTRLLEADPPPAPKSLRIALPPDLRSVMLRDLPDSIRLSAGRLEINAPTTEAMLERLALLAQAMQHDLRRFRTPWSRLHLPKWWTRICTCSCGDYGASLGQPSARSIGLLCADPL